MPSTSVRRAPGTGQWFQQPDSSANNPNLVDEVKSLREALLQTQRQMAAQQREIEILKAHSKNAGEQFLLRARLPANSSSETVATRIPPTIELRPASHEREGSSATARFTKTQEQGKIRRRRSVPSNSATRYLEPRGIRRLSRIFFGPQTRRTTSRRIRRHTLQQHRPRKRQRISHHGAVFSPQLKVQDNFTATISPAT